MKKNFIMVMVITFLFSNIAWGVQATTEDLSHFVNVSYEIAPGLSGEQFIQLDLTPVRITSALELENTFYAWEEIVSRYDENFFEDSFLILVAHMANGGSYLYDTPIHDTGELINIEINTRLPEGEWPPVVWSWLVALEIDNSLSDRTFAVPSFLGGETEIIILPPPQIPCENCGEIDCDGDCDEPIPFEQVAIPTVSPNGGTFTNSVNVTLFTETDGAVIFYSTDGTTPTTASTQYTAPFTLTATTTIRAIAVKDGMENSEVLTVTFTRQTNQSNQGNNRPRPPIIVTPPPSNNNDTIEPALPIEIDRAPSHAEPTSAPVLVNGENVAFQAYHISGHNFFRLRDIAYALNGTAAQFNVVWDGENNTILLTTGESYDIVGGEMVNNSAGAVTAQPTNSTIILNGIAVEIIAFHINGNNYFMLRDLGEALGFDVDWDEETGTILISTD